MRKLGACFLIAGLTAFLIPSPAMIAFGFQLGPFHIGRPFFGHRHYHHAPRANPNDLVRREQSQENTSDRLTFAFLYPGRALPVIFQDILWPAYSSPWPFGYEKIFSTAFAVIPADRNSEQCKQAVDVNTIVERIGKEITPTPDQTERLQKLGGAIGAAGGYLSNSCPSEIPSQPTARLQLMESQIEKLTLAIDMTHLPLQDFEQSLNSEQLGRFAAAAATPTADTREGAEQPIRSCAVSLAVVGSSIDQIGNSIQPNDEQRVALNDVHQAFEKAARDLETHCPTSVPQSAVARLETIEARLDATWRTILSIQVALANFETKLSDEQKQRFDAMTFAVQ